MHILFYLVILFSINIVKFITAIVALPQVDRETSSGIELRIQIRNFCLADRMHMLALLPVFAV